MRKSTTLAGAVVLLSLTSGSAFSQVIYRLTKLDGPGFSFNFTDINESGQVTGVAVKREFRRAFLWNGKQMRDLGTLGGRFGGASEINASGQVAGSAETSDGDVHAFLWHRGIMQDLGTLGGRRSSGAGINDSGWVVGNASTTGGGERAFLWDGATMRDLGVLVSGTSSGASAINASGQVMGYADSSDGRQHAFLWDRGIMQDLGTLGGSGSVGVAINDSGWVAGNAEADITNHSIQHAFLWDGATTRDLGTLGGSYSEATAMNASGQVAGFSFTTGDSAVHAFLWDGSSMHDLGTLGGSDSDGRAINAAGQVTGSSSLPGGTIQHAFLWDNGTLHDLNDLIDPADPLKSHVTVEQGVAINDAGYIVGLNYDSGRPVDPLVYYLLSPAAPDDLRARSFMTGTDLIVRLAWSDRFADETRFQIQRSPVVNQQCGAFTTIGSRKENVTVFRDTTVSSNTNYCYQLRVIRPTVVRTLSNIARIRTKQ